MNGHPVRVPRPDPEAGLRTVQVVRRVCALAGVDPAGRLGDTHWQAANGEQASLTAGLEAVTILAERVAGAAELEARVAELERLVLQGVPPGLRLFDVSVVGGPKVFGVLGRDADQVRARVQRFAVGRAIVVTEVDP